MMLNVDAKVLLKPIVFSFLLLSNLAFADTVDDLIAQLGSSNADTRENAAEELSKSQYRDQQRVVDALINTIRNDSNRYVRRDAGRGLQRSSLDSAKVGLISALTDSSSRGKEEAADLLGSIRDDRAIQPLRSALSSSDPDIRENAASSLRYYVRGNSGVYSDLLRVLRSDSNRYVRRDAASSLRESQNSSLANDLNSIIRDTGGSVQAFELLKSQNNADSVALMISGMSNSDADIREAAVESMDGVADELIIDALLQRHGVESNRYVKREIRERLSKMNDVRVLPVFEAILNDPDSYLHDRAAVGLAQFGNESHLVKLVGLLGDSSRNTRVHAYLAIKAILGRVNGNDSLKNLANCLPQIEYRPHSSGVQSFALLMDILMTGATVPVWSIAAHDGKVQDIKRLSSSEVSNLQSLFRNYLG